MSSNSISASFLSSLVNAQGPFVCFITKGIAGEINAGSVRIHPLRTLVTLTNQVCQLLHSGKQVWLVDVSNCTAFNVEGDAIYASGLRAAVRIPLFSDNEFFFIKIFEKFVKLMKKNATQKAVDLSTKDTVHLHMYRFVSILSDQKAFIDELRVRNVCIDFIPSVADLIQTFFIAMLIRNTQSIRSYRDRLTGMSHESIGALTEQLGRAKEIGRGYVAILHLLKKDMINLPTFVSNSIVNLSPSTIDSKTNHLLDWAIEIGDEKLICLFMKISHAQSWKLTSEQMARIIDMANPELINTALTYSGKSAGEVMSDYVRQKKAGKNPSQSAQSVQSM